MKVGYRQVAQGRKDRKTEVPQRKTSGTEVDDQVFLTGGGRQGKGKRDQSMLSLSDLLNQALSIGRLLDIVNQLCAKLQCVNIFAVFVQSSTENLRSWLDAKRCTQNDGNNTNTPPAFMVNAVQFNMRALDHAAETFLEALDNLGIGCSVQPLLASISAKCSAKDIRGLDEYFAAVREFRKLDWENSNWHNTGECVVVGAGIDKRLHKVVTHIIEKHLLCKEMLVGCAHNEYEALLATVKKDLPIGIGISTKKVPKQGPRHEKKKC